jgi:type I restriction enzyme M protein
MSQWIRGMNAALTSTPVTRALIREVVAACLLLRWLDLQDAEQEAMAVFEGRDYQPLLPEPLQWRQWERLEYPSTIDDRLRELVQHLNSFSSGSVHPLAAYARALPIHLRRILDVDLDFFSGAARWIGELPFETPSNRKIALEMFDQVIGETSEPHDSLFSTPSNIAHLVIALASPKPGDRVYDPCFGYGNLLLAARQYAEENSGAKRSQEDLLDIAGVETNSSAFLIGLTRMLLVGIDNPRLELGNSLERESPSSPMRQGYDVVLANPPIGAKIRRDQALRSQFAYPSTDSTGLFVQHALSQLKPQGRAVIAVPEGFLFRGGADRELRRHLLEKGQVEAVIALPAGSFSPYTRVKSSLLVLTKRGGISRVRMADASSMFDPHSRNNAPTIQPVIARQLAIELSLPELRKPRDQPPSMPKGRPSTGVLARSVWEIDVDELENSDWDLTPRRREKGILEALLAHIEDEPGLENAPITALGDVAEISVGRHVKSKELWDQPQNNRSLGYVRIRDLQKGTVGRWTSWLNPDLYVAERRRALRTGDVLVSKSGTIGKSAIVRDDIDDAIAASGLYVVRAHQERLNPEFLFAYLESAACKEWLKAQARGAVIQHLSRNVLDRLLVPLPPLQLQARAAAEHRDFGTDVLAFLSEAAGANDADHVAEWLTYVSRNMPRLDESISGTSALLELERLANFARSAKALINEGRVTNRMIAWFEPFVDAALKLKGVTDIPPGPSLIAVLQEAQRKLIEFNHNATDDSQSVKIARSIGEPINKWIHSTINSLYEAVNLKVISSPKTLDSGTYAEFSIELKNEGVVPLRSVAVKASADWGKTEISYLKECGVLKLNLSGDVPKYGDVVSIELAWNGRTLSDFEVGGEIKLAIPILKDQTHRAHPTEDFGGSPYVTGSPLEPDSGHRVFVGRDELIAEIRRHIGTHGNVVLLEGNRRSGKTSILKHLVGCDPIPGWLAVYSSLQGGDGAAAAAGVPTVEVFRGIARSVARAVTTLGIDAPLPNGEVIKAGKPILGIARGCSDGIGEQSPFADFSEYLELILSLLKPLRLGLLLMLDEFDKLQEGIDNGVTSPQVPENIRFLIQTYPRFSAILTGSRRLKRLREEYWSALYGLGTRISVDALDEQSARRVVIEPVRSTLAFSDDAVDRIVEVTARQPFLIQCLCNRIFDDAARSKRRSITLGNVNEAASALVRDNEHFASLWEYASHGPDTGRRRRQLILMLCAQSFKQGTHVNFGTMREQLSQAGIETEDDVLSLDLEYLRELELVDLMGEIGSGYYCLTIPLMADWIEQQQDAEVVASRALTEAEEENG